MNEATKALKSVIVQCSYYEDGSRWCDFCSNRIFGKNRDDEGPRIEPETAKHTENCPFTILQNEITILQNEIKRLEWEIRHSDLSM
jgi:hypothetical protein